MPGMTMSELAPLSWTRALTSWQLHPWAAFLIAVLLLGYGLGVQRARRNAMQWPAGAAACWGLGVLALVVATQGSPAVYEAALFWMHMVAHLLLIMIAPLLLVAGRPLDLLIAASAPRSAERIRRALTGRVVSAATHPAVGLVLYGAVIAGTHLTDFMNTMMMHPWLRGFEQAAYVVAGAIFFLPLVGTQPIRWQLSWPLRMAIYVVAMPIDTFTGVILGQETHYPWPMMAATHPAWAPSLLTDLHAGGAVMWIGGDAIMAVLFGVAAVGWAQAASAGDGSELGGWLTAVRSNYLHDLTKDQAAAGSAVDMRSRDGGSVDDDETLAAYNAYLDGLGRR